jgi:hypothetical protein
LSFTYNGIYKANLVDEFQEGNLLESKKLLSAIIVAAIFVLLAPILYKLTRKQLQQACDKDIGENLSGECLVCP